MGPKLVIDRSVTGCHRRRCHRGEPGLPKCIIDIRQPFLASASVAVGLRSVGYRRTSAASRISIVDASNAPNFVEITPSLRNAETIKPASRDARRSLWYIKLTVASSGRARTAACPVLVFSYLGLPRAVSIKPGFYLETILRTGFRPPSPVRRKSIF